MSSIAEISLGDRIELATVALELLALRLDDRRRRVGDEALVREHRLRARDLFPQALDLRGRVAVRLRALGLHDRVEDPPLLALERGEDAAAPEPLGRLLHPLERVGLRLVAGLGPRRDDQARLPSRQVRPDLLCDV